SPCSITSSWDGRASSVSPSGIGDRSRFRGYNRAVLRPRAALTLVLMLSSAPVRAMDDFTGTRAIGMGDAGRAYAVGDSGPMLNPSGMSLVKNFQVLEGSYGYSYRLRAHTLHASMVDNTSGFGIGGGLYYNYHSSEPGGGVTG